MGRILTLAYGALSYLIFFLTFLYAIGFIGNLVVPKSLDSGPTDPWATALAIDLALLSLFRWPMASGPAPIGSKPPHCSAP
jgi:hypothetical protein